MGDLVSLLDRPVYTYPQVDRLLGLSDGTANRWLNGYKRKGVFYEPILRPQRQGTRWVTWGEFVETRLFAGYRDVDQIPVRRMRRVVEVLRERSHRTYPLAHAQPYLRPEGRLMLWEAQKEAGLPDDEFAVVLESGQLVLSPWVDKFVKDTDLVETSDEDSSVNWIRPDSDFPSVHVHPLLRGGEPVIDGRNVRVATLAGLVRGGENIADVAEWYELPEDQVRQAVNYDRIHLRIA